ncbi:MAG: hypothetical protein K2Q03_02525 [Sphingobacteriaceae bacterium]|nr:hypothetical protein [Sphingobacteriaceae bacterium]
MKKQSVKFLAIALIGLTIASCKKNESKQPSDGGVDLREEFAYVNVFLNDFSDKNNYLINPKTGSITPFVGNLVKANLYTTESKRYALSISSDAAGKGVQVFDLGIENHGDHMHKMGTPKWASMGGNFTTPVHFFSLGGELSIFDDGDGKISLGKESEVHTGNFSKVNSDGATPHHGAMIRFKNGNYAITIDDNSVDGFNKSLPERVQIINPAGAVVSSSTVATKGIHGDAGDGNIAIFGAYGGVLVVKQDGTQSLIPYPNNFAITNIMGTSYYAEGVKKFYGRSGNAGLRGIYQIDVNANNCTPVFVNENIAAVSLSFDEKKMVILLLDGSVKWIDLASNKIIKEGAVIPAFASTDTEKPSLASTEKFIYITMPSTGELWQVATKDLSIAKKIKVGTKPNKITLLGKESNE